MGHVFFLFLFFCPRWTRGQKKSRTATTGGVVLIPSASSRRSNAGSGGKQARRQGHADCTRQSKHWTHTNTGRIEFIGAPWNVVKLFKSPHLEIYLWTGLGICPICLSFFYQPLHYDFFYDQTDTFNVSTKKKKNSVSPICLNTLTEHVLQCENYNIPFCSACRSRWHIAYNSKQVQGGQILVSAC